MVRIAKFMGVTILVLAVPFGLFLLVMGFLPIIQVPCVIALGWVPYLGRVVPQLHPDPWVVLTSIICLIAVTLGSHAFLNWLYAASSTEPRRWRWKWSLQLVGLVVLMFVSGIGFTGMVHQTSWLARSPEPFFKGGVREPSARASSANNLKQIGLAAANFASGDELKQALPCSTFDATGRPMHSWLAVMLPQFEMDAVKRNIDYSKPWNDPANAKWMGTPLKIFLNPSLPKEQVNGQGVCHYAGNVHVVLSDTPKTLTSFPAGTSNTILAGEVSSNFRPWGDPLNARDPKLGANSQPNGFGGPKRPAQFVMLDGSVRTFDPAELAELLGKVPE